MYILHCDRICPSVRSLSALGPVTNFMPLASSQPRTAWPSASLTCCISANSALWLSRSLNTPVACSSSSELRRCLTPHEVFLQSANFPQCFGMIEHQEFFRQLIGVGEINLRQSARHLVQGGRVETRAAQK